MEPVRVPEPSGERRFQTEGQRSNTGAGASHPLSVDPGASADRICLTQSFEQQVDSLLLGRGPDAGSLDRPLVQNAPTLEQRQQSLGFVNERVDLVHRVPATEHG